MNTSSARANIDLVGSERVIAQNLTLFAEEHDQAQTWRNQVLRRLVRMRYQLLGGLSFGVGLPLVLALNSDLAWPLLPQSYNTLLATAFAVLVGFVFLRKTLSLPGSAAMTNVLPAFLLSFAIAMGTLLAFRIEYSRLQMLLSGIFAVVWFYGVTLAIMRAKRPVFGVVSGGRSSRLLDVGAVDTVELGSIAEAEARGALPLVADLQSKSLSDDWQRYLAEQAIRGRSVFNARPLVESLTGKVQIDHISENNVGQLDLDQLYRPAKRYLDAAIAGIFLTLLSPVFLAVATMIRLDSRGPAIFRQTRMGFRGETFTVFKFRSMRLQTPDEEGRDGDMTRSDDARITRIGRIIRKLRIDELPQLINVIRGEMSLIGPRPETLRLSEWYEREIPFYRIRHSVRPGITGWAQVRQGHVTSVDDVREKLAYDLFYVKNFSIWFDVLIVIHTLRVVFTGHGAK